MPDRQRKRISIETPEKKCTKPTRQYGITKYAEKNSLHPTMIHIPKNKWQKLTMPQNNKSCHSVPSEPRTKISIR
jgi:hypothetical protein